MTLRNAFANLVTESVSGAIEALANKIAVSIDNLDDREYRRGLVETPRALQYARTVADAMRVNIENTGYQVTVQPGNVVTGFTNVATPLWFGPSTVYTVDEREQQRIQSEQQINAVRQGRWVIT